MQAPKALACLHIWEDSPDPSLLDNAISTKISCAGSNALYPSSKVCNIFHDFSKNMAEASLITGNFACFYFQNQLFQEILSGTLSDCHRVCILSVLIWVQTVCKVYLQRIKVVACKERVNEYSQHFFLEKYGE